MTVLSPQVSQYAGSDYGAYISNDATVAIKFNQLLDGWVLCLGDDQGSPTNSSAGMSFQAQVTAPAGGDGRLAYVQLVNGRFHVDNADGTSFDLKSTGGNWVADGPPVPYGGADGIVQFSGLTATIANSDLPALPTIQDSQIRVDASFDFQTFLMYQPPGANSIWVTLQEIDWGWSAVVTHPAGTSWADVASNPFGSTPMLRPPTPTALSSTRLPIWTGFPQ